MSLPILIPVIAGAFVAIGVLQFAALVAIGYLFRAFDALFSQSSEPTENERMEIIRRQLDELWDDEEDPRAERTADADLARKALVGRLQCAADIAALDRLFNLPCASDPRRIA